MFQKQSKNVTAKWFLKNEKKIRFDLTIQRNEVWDHDRKSLFIHSLILDYPVPALYAQDTQDDNLWMLDGKQRITSLLSFLKGEYELSENIPDVDGQEVAGLNFSELDEDFQDSILSYSFLIYSFKNMTDEERDEMFLRLNNGMALTKMELTRVTAGSGIMKFIKQITEHEFFTKVALTNKAKNRFVDEEVVLQTVALLHKQGDTGLSSKELSQFVLELKDKGLTEEEQKLILNTAEYLNTAFEEKDRSLKKVNIPIIFFVASQVKDEIPAQEFGQTTLEFLNYCIKNPGTPYGTACSAGSAKKDKVRNRVVELTKEIEKLILKQTA